MKLYGSVVRIKKKMVPEKYKETFKLITEQMITVIDRLDDEIPVHAEIFINRLGSNDSDGKRALSFCWKLTTEDDTIDLFEGSLGVIGKQKGEL